MNSIPAAVKGSVVLSIQFRVRLKRDVACTHSRLADIVDTMKVMSVITIHQEVSRVGLQGREYSSHHQLSKVATSCQWLRTTMKYDVCIIFAGWWSVSYKAVKLVCH